MANTQGNNELDFHTLTVQVCPPAEKRKGRKQRVLVIFSLVGVVVGQSAGTLLSRYYFEEGGSSRWLQSLLPCVGWPILLLLILANPRRESSIYSVRFFMACAALGLLSAIDNVLYTWGVSFLPVSTFSLLCSTQLAFTAVFAFMLVRQRINSYTLNSLVLLTLSAVLLGLHSDNDRPQGVSHTQFIWGFVFTILASAMFALICPLVQLLFKRTTLMETFGIVVETQVYIFMSATLVTLVGLFGSGDFRDIRREAQIFRAGEVAYYMQLIWSAIAWQMCYLGSFGLVFLVSSLFSNVISTLTLPIVPILAVFIFNDKMDAIKIMAMIIGIWGFVSYCYGELHVSS